MIRMIAIVLLVGICACKQPGKVNVSSESGLLNKDSLDRIDSTIAFLREELLFREWIKKDEEIKLTDFEPSDSSFTVLHSRVEGTRTIILNQWILLPKQYALIDTITGKEFMWGPIITEEDSQKAKNYDPFKE